MKIHPPILFVLLTTLFGIAVFNWSSRSADASFSTALVADIATLVFVVVVLLRLNRDILLRKKTQKKLKESEAQYRIFVENAGVVSFTTDEQGYFAFTSKQAEALTGFTTAELKGKHFTELIRPDHVMQVVEHYTRQKENLVHETTLVFPVVHRNGQMKWVEQDTILLLKAGKPAGFQSIVRDVTEKVAMDQRIREMENEQKAYHLKIQSILDHTPLAIYVKDTAGRYTLINKSFRDNFNVTDDEVIGKTMFDLRRRNSIDKYLEADELVKATAQPVETEDVLTFPDGDHHVLTIKFPLFDENNQLFAISGFMKDITEMVRYREELISARQRAETAESLQEQFLANMSHEIRTPMNGIIGMTNLLMKTELNQTQQEYVQIIKQSSDNLLMLINDILDLSKIKAGKISIEKIPFNLRQALEALAAGFRMKAEEKHIGFSFEAEADVPLAVKGDPYRLNQVLSNLLSNAMKFTDKGSVSLNVKVGGHEDNVIRLRFDVKDTGIGIEEKNLGYIFESFAQESVSTTRKYGGTGLGLAITRRLVEMQAGEIAITSKPGAGSTFSVTLPFIISSEKEVNDAIAPQVIPLSEGHVFEGKKVLIVEDNEINRMVLQASLSEYNLDVAIAQNGLEAINHLHHNGHVDLILMDLHMPEMDGYQATQYIRHTLKLNVPIVILTASALRNEKEKSVALGASDYLTKPFVPEKLQACLQQYLGTGSPAPDEPENNPAAPDESSFDLSGLLRMTDTRVIKTIHAMFEKVIPEGLTELQQFARANNWEQVRFVAHKLKGTLGVIRIHGIFTNMQQVEAHARDEKHLDTILPMIATSIKEFDVVSPIIRQHLEKEVFSSMN